MGISFRQLVGNQVRLIKSNFKSKEEKDLMKKRNQFYSQFLISEGDIYFDVGANYGNRIEPIIDKKLVVIAVEPQLQCIQFLRKKFGDRINIVPKGLGSEEGVETMYIANADVISSFSKEWIDSTKASGRFSKYNWNKERQVEITTLDNLIERFGKPKFIKIDVEGFEPEVLKGLSHPIEYISFEYATPEGNDAVIECIDRIVEVSNNHKVKFNYSIGESMEWALEEWLSPEKMKEEVRLDKFIQTDFGDIYSKLVKEE